MKKIIIFLFSVIVATTVNAQKAIETSRFTDNMSITLQGGVVTPWNHFFKDGSTTPIVVLGVEKYFNPWFGVEVEGRTSIGTGDSYNPHTAFDMVNVSGYAKFNIANMISYNGKRHFFEPVVYTGIGWGHYNCSGATTLEDIYNHESATIYVNGTKAKVGLPSEDYGMLRNFITFRSGCEFNFNFGKDRAWAIVVNPSVVWGNVDNGRLDVQHAYVEGTAGIKYRFANANGTHAFKVYNIGELNDEINSLRAENEELKNRKPEVITNNNTITKEVSVDRITVITFAQNSDELSAEAQATLNNVKASSVIVMGYASPEGETEYNKSLSEHRAANVADYLKNHGVNITSCEGKGAVDENSNRIVYVIAQ